MDITYIIYFIFAFMMFFILIRESIIDIKTMYVPDNIVYGAYGISICYIIIQTIIQKDYSIFLNAIIGFVVGFGIPYFISYMVYVMRKIKSKFFKKNLKEVSSVIETECIESTGKKSNIKNYIFYSIIVLITTFIGLNQDTINSIVFILIALIIITAISLIYHKTKKIEFVFYSISIVSIILVSLYWNTMEQGFWKYSILFASVGFLIEIGLGKILSKFYNVEKLIAEDKEYEEQHEEVIYGGIGGGDILIFGALGIMFGFKALIAILIYSCFAQLLIILSYYLLNENIGAYLPFVPGIAFGTLLFISGYDLLNIQSLISFMFRILGV
ncbi:prepilin peptidase [Alkaliphilus sp. B6464]|uniref:prepilin peptidase n=1 Tax=Alkaliphilus sp. B6464 TaxID=2731219 RepID=UPI001BA4FB19|nr:prepilin peptidase [Alkaliphilus sp. B6464]QUH22115.1 prepilin peptidase [Alkaliphilus sp. B6464]